ncbi:MAG: FtsW/RodA/SpoVE family cell cycle protein, partial [Bacteroidetes bacterium]|nr:FtsW/RodA/SpoVE family cell cycle protein [Bacteroidota bacterium]
MRPSQRKSAYDRITLLLLFTLSIVGVLMNFAVEYPDAGHLFQLPLETHFQKQSLFIILGGVIFLFVALFDRSIWHSLAYPIYFFGLLTLILVLVFGHTVKGSTSWFIIGGFTIQPSEFVKFGTILALSSFLSHYTTNLKRLSDRLVGMAIILVPTGLILLQPDAGSATVFSILFLVLLRAGISPIYYLLLIILILTGVFSLQYPLPAVAFCLVMAAVFLLAFKKSERG